MIYFTGLLFEGDPLQQSSFEEPDFVLTPQRQAEAAVVCTWCVDSSKQIHLNLLSWAFHCSIANRLPAE